jgi:putative transposase
MSPNIPPIILVERHVIKRADPRYGVIDAAAFASKNLYNLANYQVRQTFFGEGRWLRWGDLFRCLKTDPAYCALPRKVSNLVLQQVDRNWKAFFQALKAWREEPTRFLGRPKPPGYKDKQKGRNLLVYDTQALSKRCLRQGVIQPSKLGIEIKTNKTDIKQVRIVPRQEHYVIEAVYASQPKKADVNPDLVAGIDIGLSNLATLTSNKRGFQPLAVNGRPLKAMNQYYNKHKAKLQSQLPGQRHTSHRIQQLTHKRNQKVRHYLHGASRMVVNHLVHEGIGTLVIGQNKQWKQAINLGKQTNQNFVTIPLTQFVHMLTYKAQLVGIQVIIHEESYTSKCSFLDLEPVGKQAVYVGRRIQRGLFRSAAGRFINADVNGAYNIIRKAIPKAFADGIEGVAVHPMRVTPA